MKYDDASWHSGGNFPKDLPPEAGATHTGMFVAWAFLSGLAGELHISDSPEDIQKLESRSVTPGQSFLESCDGKFTDEDLNAEGNAFTRAYFNDFAVGQYLADYEGILGKGLTDLYHVHDTWENYDRLRPVLDQRFAEWKAGKPFSRSTTDVRDTSTPAAKTLQPRLLRLLIAISVTIGALLMATWFLWPPRDLSKRRRVNEVAAVATLRRIHEMQVDYAASNPTRGFSCFLDSLQHRDVGDDTVSYPFHSTDMRTGYKFTIIGFECRGESPVRLYQVTAVPLELGKTGDRAYCSDQERVVWYDDDGSAKKCLSSRKPM